MRTYCSIELYYKVTSKFVGLISVFFALMIAVCCLGCLWGRYNCSRRSFMSESSAKNEVRHQILDVMFDFRMKLKIKEAISESRTNSKNTECGGTSPRKKFLVCRSTCTSTGTCAGSVFCDGIP